MLKNNFPIAIVVILLVLGIYLLFSKGSKPESVQPMIQTTQTQPTPPALEIDKTKKYEAILNTSMGEITIELNAGQTPITVNNFIYLSKKGFYNKTIFHRVIKGFMIQGGDPEGTGRGGPGYKFDDEPFNGDYVRGVVAMANAGPNTNGSQFFIMHQDYQLPKNYVIFGKVTSGMETVDKIAEAETLGEQPKTPTTIESVQIINN